MPSSPGLLQATLNAEFLKGATTGTSGNAIPLLNGTNIWGDGSFLALQTFEGPVTYVTEFYDDNFWQVKVNGENPIYPRLQCTGEGQFKWAGIGAAPDTVLYRSGVGALQTDGNFSAAGFAVGATPGVDGSFTAVGKTVTVTKGIITAIV